MTACDIVGSWRPEESRWRSSLRVSAVSLAIGGAMLLSGGAIGGAEAAPVDDLHSQSPVIADLAPGSFGPATAEYQVAATDDIANDATVDGEGKDAQAAHDDLFGESRYPSAATCGTCHPKQYEEWAISQHSYAQLSPVYMAINNFLNFSTSSSMGDFCLRCHNQVGANLGESPFISNLERHPTSREGITCVVCHRITKGYNKVSGRLALAEGSLLDPVMGPSGNAEMERVLKDDKYRVVTEEKELGRKIHTQAKKFAPISTPTFCGSCHDVTLFNGFRLEEAFSEYRLSPAADRGVTCQDCHMGKIQGIPSDFDYGPAAVVGGVPTKPRKLSNHLFSGPDYSVIHPGIFPHNADAQQLASLEDWLKFDHEAGWGTDEFEDKVAGDYEFPNVWASIDDRYDARDILDIQFERLDFARKKRLEVLRNGYHLGDVKIEEASAEGIEFEVEVKNITDGHNVPTGFTGERLVWLEVEVKDRDSNVVFTSGDRDPNGDLRDLHSLFVHNGELPEDPYLFSLQSKFVVTQGRGGEREAVIPIPYTVTALPIVRPTTLSLVFAGEPTTERNHRKGIEPLGNRWASYEIDGDKLTGKGPYTASIRLNSQMVPVNLITAVQRVGFDYGMSAKDVADAVVEGSDILWEKMVTFNVHSGSAVSQNAAGEAWIEGQLR